MCESINIINAGRALILSTIGMNRALNEFIRRKKECKRNETHLN